MTLSLKILETLRAKKNLSAAETVKAFEAIMGGEWETETIQSFLLLLRAKGESVTEIVSAAKVMKKHSLKLSKSYPQALDTCGTGGDAKNTLNISTLSAVTASAAGVLVAKHGNRSVSSLCGSADLLEAFGVKIDLRPSQVEACMEKVGFGFFFAPVFHPSVKNAMQARRNISGKTVFNLLGPLTNPAGSKRQLLGVYSRETTLKLSKALKALGAQRFMVVNSADGLDEISLSGKTFSAVYTGSSVRATPIDHVSFGLKKGRLSDIQCSSKEENIQKAREVLKGADGAALQVVCANTAAALVVAGKTKTLKEGYRISRETLIAGKALKKMDELASFTRRIK